MTWVLHQTDSEEWNLPLNSVQFSGNHALSSTYLTFKLKIKFSFKSETNKQINLALVVASLFKIYRPRNDNSTVTGLNGLRV